VKTIQHTYLRNGFTLLEFLFASAIGLLVVFAMVAVFIYGYDVLREGTVQTWAQQNANHAMEQIASLIRPAQIVKVYGSYGPSPGVDTIAGNFLVTAGDGYTSGIYRSGAKLYYVPNMLSDNMSSSADDYILAANLYNSTLFSFSNFHLNVTFSIYDPRQTNQVLVSAYTSVSARNK
jgi:hypothetical protein